MTLTSLPVATPTFSRREFLAVSVRAAIALPAARWLPGRRPQGRAWRPAFPDPARGSRGESSVAAALRGELTPRTARPPAFAAPFAREELRPLPERFPDLRRHFVFEYYPWYGGPPDYEHWTYLGRHPPDDLAANYVPRLGAYDVRSTAVLEQHARWIAESGVGTVALSWWGRDSFSDAATSLVMDVMRAHDVKVTFCLEPYRNDRGERWADDVLHLLREYGEKRGWDALLVLEDEDGSEGPVFKGFRCILPSEVVDCHGAVHRVPDYTPDDVWRRQTDALREATRRDFDHVTLLADSLEFRRTPASGFDGIGIYDNFIPPEDYAGYAEGASAAGLLFSFNVNPGYDEIEPRDVDPDSCYRPRPFAPPTDDLDWTKPEDRERAALRSRQRIVTSFQATLEVQQRPDLSNARRGFLLAYVNSFNEWHEGHAFEPMKDAAELSPEERAFPYHNPARGDGRLVALRALVRSALTGDPRPGGDPAFRRADAARRQPPPRAL
ncbi:MAG: hypothetical protein HY317_06180 [Acidobacteria bacterium]|nr:hypothetical protein [Acidobacteriota bacterium]